MIAYDLQCANDHTFEGWFQNRKTYKAQSRKKQISCPVCGDTSVVTVPSRFSMRADDDKSEGRVQVEKIMEFLENNFENVGPNFAREALKMHYDVTEKRNIRGTSTETEQEMLKKEGITFFKLPVPRLDS